MMPGRYPRQQRRMLIRREIPQPSTRMIATGGRKRAAMRASILVPSSPPLPWPSPWPSPCPAPMLVLKLRYALLRLPRGSPVCQQLTSHQVSRHYLDSRVLSHSAIWCHPGPYCHVHLQIRATIRSLGINGCSGKQKLEETSCD